jgi:lipopolysaccharide transport system ATP-binding protein
MSEIAIRAEGIGKKYYIGGVQARYKTLRETLAETLTTPFRRAGQLLRGRAEGIAGLREEFWALKDVSFEVKEGEVVGIIGRNGAGKSTLLKILSRITEPAEGYADIYGRVGALLEVGTGFHPELTGRENIYLNGAILGMKRKEINRKFDEIVAFAEVEHFLDTPAKHYSSGMYMRLAFAVAAHLEPEILIIDEVLSVGDAAFQKKCLGKIGSIANEGRTTLFVTHNMRSVQQLCNRAIWIDKGHIVAEGEANDVVDRYLQSMPIADSPEDIATIIDQLPADPTFRLRNIEVTQDGERVSRILSGRPLTIRIGYDVLEYATGFRVFFDLCDQDGIILFRSFNDDQADDIPTTEPGMYISQATIPANILAPTAYELRIYATIFNVRMCVPGLGVRIPVTVEASGRINRAYHNEPIRGKLALDIPWTTSPVEEYISQP